MSEETTHFGYQSILTAHKTERVKSVFQSVANQYDLMNDLMSFGLHRIWKRIAVSRCHIRPTDYVLDLAGGTGDLSQQFARQVGSAGKVILADINDAMLQKGRKRLIDKGILQPVSLVEANAEILPFKNNCFDRIIMAFGLRNVTYKEKVFSEMVRVLKPGGRVVILEFSKVSSNIFNDFYHAYSFSVLPKLGKWIAKDEASYRYLAESIRMHPDQETLKAMMQEAGLNQCEYQNLNDGICAIHMGIKTE